MYRSILIIAALAGACTPPDDVSTLRPSLTMIRTEEVVVEDPPVVPLDRFVPGFVTAPEEVVYEGEDAPVVAPPPGQLTDLGAMSDMDDPAPLDEHVPGSTYEWGTQAGNLWDLRSDEGQLEYDDVEQGAIGDCYMVSALSAVLWADNDFLVRDGLIREITHADGTVSHYAVRLYDAWGDPQDVLVDAQMMRKYGRPLYARSMDSDKGAEEWGISLVEKAYAKWHGSYQDIGDGGWAGDVMQALTGSTAVYKSIRNFYSDSSMLKAMRDAVADDRPVVAGTWGKDDGVDYTGTGVYAWHAYTVLDADPDEGTVTLRNPWGSSEPPGNGEDDGIFTLDVETFKKLYQGITLGGGFSSDFTAPSEVDDLEVVSQADGTVTLRFTATGDDRTKGMAAAYDIRWSTSELTAATFYDGAKVDPAPSPQSPGTVEEVSFSTEAAPGTTLWAAVRVEDEAGNISPVSNILQLTLDGGATEITAYPPQVFDFEAGRDLWATEGLFHFSTGFPAGGDWHAWMGDESELSHDASGTSMLISPPIDLREASSATLVFDHYVDLDVWDAAPEVQVRRWTGSDWSADGIDQVLSSSEMSDYTSEEIVLDALAGEIIEIRFVFEHESGRGEGHFGWLIDEVGVLAD